MLSMHTLDTARRELRRLVARSNHDGLDTDLMERIDYDLKRAEAALARGDEGGARECVLRALGAEDGPAGGDDD